MQKPSFGKRGLRRDALARKKAQARRVYPHDPRARQANHMANCSCWMCGNPRRHSGERTLQERRAEESARAEPPSTE